MDLKNLLQEKRSHIIKKWRDVILSTYPEQGQNFLRHQKDDIANPVGCTISEGIESIYDELLKESESDQISLFLDNIIRVRAIQDFAPSQAVSFIFGLKDIIREVLESEIRQGKISEELIAFESKIDGLALLCFDIYNQCRQKIFQIRVNEVRNESSRLLKMAGLVYEIPEIDGDLKEDKVNNNG
ncbi:MAG: RsbRD N-terminal domain-containing protein [Desulfobacteria bacterium]